MNKTEKECRKKEDKKIIEQENERENKKKKEIVKRVNQNAMKYAKDTTLNIARIKI